MNVLLPVAPMYLFSLFGTGRAPLNTTMAFYGFKSMAGAAGALFLVLYTTNVFALQIACRVAARGQTAFAEILIVSVVLQFIEILLSAALAQYLGIYSIIPIFIVTVILLIRACHLTMHTSVVISGFYYVYHIVSLLAIRLLFSLSTK